MRGKPSQSGCASSTLGLIPAYAGKTPRWFLPCWSARAHPRVCGENSKPSWMDFCRPGSSPRMRGKPRILPRNEFLSRLIPAYAGKTGGRTHPHPRRRAHPRVCGENAGHTAMALQLAGSSPRMRGKPMWEAGTSEPSGLIPAYAGKTRRGSPEAPLRGAHPRVCGENSPF
mgnify:CR=1 FL=1